IVRPAVRPFQGGRGRFAGRPRQTARPLPAGDGEAMTVFADTFALIAWLNPREPGSWQFVLHGRVFALPEPAALLAGRGAAASGRTTVPNAATISWPAGAAASAR